jgi:hypothetical protein
METTNKQQTRNAFRTKSNKKITVAEARLLPLTHIRMTTHLPCLIEAENNMWWYSAYCIHTQLPLYVLSCGMQEFSTHKQNVNTLINLDVQPGFTNVVV